MQTERKDFPGADGQKLAARLDAPSGPVKAYALFAHCFTCGKDVFAASRIAQALTEHGIAVLRFDFTGLGASEGDFANTNFSSNVADLVAAADFMRREHAGAANPDRPQPGRRGGAGRGRRDRRSEGGGDGGRAERPVARARIVWRRRWERSKPTGEAEVQLAGRPFKIKRQFLIDAAEQNLSAKTAALKRALLVMHSPKDTTVDISNAEAIFIAAKHPKSFISLDDADHLLTRREDAVYVAAMIAAWSERYLG